MSGSDEVDAFMAALDHPLKGAIEEVRGVICGVDAGISEAIKWKAPSFRFKDDFATVNLRATDAVQLILHTGAKVKDTAVSGVPVDDPAGLLKWLAKDRCLATLANGRGDHEALAAIVGQWISHM